MTQARDDGSVERGGRSRRLALFAGLGLVAGGALVAGVLPSVVSGDADGPTLEVDRENRDPGTLEDAGGDESPEWGEGFDGRAVGTLVPMSDAPIGMRHSAEAVWTGDEVIVYGGMVPWPFADADAGGATAADASGESSPRHEWRPRGDGARWDPATDAWRTMDEAPAGGGVSAAVAWTGEELFVWGGFDAPSDGLLGSPLPVAHGARYDPATEAWTELPEGPLEPRSRAIAEWTGDEVWVVSGRLRTEYGPETALDGAAYDPEHDTWRHLPDLPAEAGGEPGVRGGAWLDDRLVVVSERSVHVLAADEEAWRTHALDVGRAVGEQFAFLDAPVVLPNGTVVAQVRAPQRDRAPAAAAAGTPVPGPPVLARWSADGGDLEPIDGGPPTLATWSADTVEAVEDGVALLYQRGSAHWLAAWWRDVDDHGQWLRLPDALVQDRFGPAVAWTDDSLVVWGGIQQIGTAPVGVRWSPGP